MSTCISDCYHCLCCTLFFHSDHCSFIACNGSSNLFVLEPAARMQSSFVGTVKPFQATRVAVARPVRVATTIENRVAIRFQRFGRKKAPFYRLVAIESKDRRDGRPLEYLG